VVIWHVLEHLHDPKGTLHEANRILRPGGRLVVAVPNLSSLQARWAGAGWFHLDLPRHLWHFPLASLRMLLSDCGFEIQSEHHFSLRQNPFGWVQSALNRVPGLPHNGLYTLLQRRAPHSPPPFDAATRAWLWASFLVGTPLGLAATLVETVLRSGATVHLVAVRHSR
jgi:SAM-dependent methyltransferase